MLKMLRLAEQIEWASEHESLGPVGQFLRALREGRLISYRRLTSSGLTAAT
jgi:hypothetical protein